jgi:RNA recognition motif-containing protein
MTTIFVGNLGAEIREARLLDLFGAFGAVERIALVNDRDTGQPRGFAFVEMLNSSAALSAISSLNGKPIDGRPLRVNEARSKPAEDRSQPATSARDHRRHRI